MSPELIEDMLDTMKNTTVGGMRNTLSEVLTECMDYGIYTDLDLVNMLSIDLMDLDDLLEGGETFDQKPFNSIFSKIYNDLKKKKGKIIKEYYSEE